MNKLFRNRQNSGITLIALVITIIILLILAGITISSLTNNGLFDKARDAKETTNVKKAEEEIKLLLSEWQIENITEDTTLVSFFGRKLNENKIDDFEEIDEGISIIKSGYELVVDNNGKIVQEIQKTGPRPLVDRNSLRITLEDGTEIDDYTQVLGTKLKITFNTSIENGEIKEVTLQDGTAIQVAEGVVTYITNGTEQEVLFKIVGTVDGEDYNKNVKISIGHKYEVIYKSESLIKAIEENNLEDGVCKIQVAEEIYNVRVYNFEGNKIITEDTQFGEAEDVATENEEAKNMVILKVNGDLTINEGAKLTTYGTQYGGPKGMMIYCTGTLTNNGEISMTARGAKATGQNVYLWKNKDASYEYVPANGASGGDSVKTSDSAGKKGNDGTNRATGGGGSGASAYGTNTGSTSGQGASGTSYSGGTGGGGAAGGEIARATAGTENGR